MTDWSRRSALRASLGGVAALGLTPLPCKGEYYFRTVKPVPYPGRTPHIHIMVRKGRKDLLTTQLYIRGEPQNARDGVLRGIRDKKARASVQVPFRPLPGSEIGELAAHFDIVLGYTPAQPDKKKQKKRV